MTEDSKAQNYISTLACSRPKDFADHEFHYRPSLKEEEPYCKDYTADSDCERLFLEANSAALASLLSKVSISLTAN